jgi:hypothetical protein
MDTMEAVVHFAVLWKCWKVYLEHSRNSWKRTDLIHHTPCGEGFETAGVWVYKPVAGIVVLKIHVNTQSRY